MNHHARIGLPLLSLVILAACTGSFGDDRGVAGPTLLPAQCTADAPLAPRAPLRRLANVEYLRTMSTLFPGITPDLPQMPADVPGGSTTYENDADALGATDVNVARYEEIAFAYTAAATATSTALRALIGCDASASRAEQDACAARFVDRFGLATHRRPLTRDERADYLAQFDAERDAIDFPAAVQLTLMAMLQGPDFLYRVELGARPARVGEAIVPLSDWEIATRLSYFLWQDMPDEELFELAQGGMLHDRETLEAEARRMLDDPRAEAAVVDFHRQWLDFDRILDGEHATRANDADHLWRAQDGGSPQRFAVEEMERFVGETIFRGEGTVAGLLTSRTAMVNRTMAGLYGVEGPADDETWARVELPSRERAGLLTRVGFLASHAHPGNPSAPLRGVYVTERFLCEPRPTPPPDANLDPPAAGSSEALLTSRGFIEQRTTGTCLGCHRRINGIGFGFEHYDERGAFRAMDHGQRVDSSGELLDARDATGTFEDAIGLSEHLAESHAVDRCVARQWARFALGRAPDDQDECFLARLEQVFLGSHGDVRELMVGVVTQPEILSRPALGSELGVSVSSSNGVSP